MAKIVLCLVLVVTMVVAAHARLVRNADGFPEARFQNLNGPGRLISSESFGSTEAVQGDNYQASLYDFDRMQEDTTTMTNSYSDSFATETLPSSSFADDSFSTETNNYVNPAQGVSYNYASETVSQYEEGLKIRSHGAGSTEGGAEKAASFTLEGNTEKTDSVVWTESEP